MTDVINRNRFSSVQRFIFIRHDAVGDLMTLLPSLKAIKRFYPHSEITVLASRYSKNHVIAEQCPYVDHVIKAPDLNDKEQCKVFKGAIKKNEYDCVVHCAVDPAIYSLLRHASRIHIGDKSVLSLWWVFRKWGVWVSPNDLMRHQVEYHFMLLKKLDIPEELVSHFDAKFTPVIPPSERMKTLLKEYGRRFKLPLIVIQVGSAGGNKPVYPNKYHEFCISLQEKLKCDIALIGYGKEEDLLARDISTGLKRPIINLVSKIPMDELFLFLKEVDLLVGVDTGPIHMATALDLPVLLLSTSKRITPFKWGPWLSRQKVVRNNGGCHIPCKARVCELTQCSDDLPVSLMVATAMELLNGGGVSGYDELQLHWFQESMNIAVLYRSGSLPAAKEYADQLEVWGVKVWLRSVDSPDLLEFLISNDIRIVHNFSKRNRIRLFFYALIMNFKEIHLPLIIHSRSRPETLDRLLPFYRSRFRSRI